MKKFHKAVSLLLAFCLLDTFSVFAYHTPTHELINEHIIENGVNVFWLDIYLKEQLNFQKGKDEMFTSQEGECKKEETYKVVDWIKHGGSWEDNPPPDFPDLGFLSCPYAIRAFNHYYNPVKDGGLSSFGGKPVTEWFMSQRERTIFWKNMGDYSWDDVRGCFYNALTSSKKIMRDDAFADTFRGLGHLMHLIEDMSVPEHARNDGHPGQFGFRQFDGKEVI